MTLSVYKIEAKLRQSRVLASDDYERSDPLLLAQAEQIDSESLPVFFVADPRDPDANFYYFTSNLLLFDELAYDVMADLFDGAGQVLPIEVEGVDKRIYLLNVLEKISAIDEERSQWSLSDSGERMTLIDFHFIASRLTSKSTLFKIPEIFYNPVLTCHDDSPDSDDFIARYRRSGLTGLTFEKLWKEER